MNYVTWSKRKAVAAGLRRIDNAPTSDAAERCLEEFAEAWGDTDPPILQSWRRLWAKIIPFFDYSPEIRRIIYTTNAIESVNMSLRKVTKNRGSFPSEDALIKLFYLALQNIQKNWALPLRDWKPALNRFTIQFADRMPSL